MRYPDFLCIGMPKSGTTWLYHHLKGHPGFWLPPIKEISYLWGFDRREYSLIELLSHRRYVFKKKFQFLKKSLRSHFSKRGGDKHSSLAWDLHYALFPESRWWYRYNFPKRTELLRGDISPQYHMLGEREIKKIQHLNPEMKILIVLLEPVSRLWSLARMKMRAAGITEFKIEDQEVWKEKLEIGMKEGFDYVDIIKKWSHFFPSSLHICYFDELENQPDHFLEHVLNFLQVPVISSDVQVLKEKIWNGPNVDMPSFIEDYLVKKNKNMIKDLFGYTRNEFVRKWLTKYD